MRNSGGRLFNNLNRWLTQCVASLYRFSHSTLLLESKQKPDSGHEPCGSEQFEYQPKYLVGNTTRTANLTQWSEDSRICSKGHTSWPAYRVNSAILLFEQVNLCESLTYPYGIAQKRARLKSSRTQL